METKKFCLACSGEIKGRADKKFCDSYCKSSYHYKKNRQNESFYLEVHRQLKKNRSILKTFNKAGKAIVKAQILIDKGFDPKFFTHYWKNSQGDVYLFVYEFGFLSRTENGKKKYILVTWQPYMEK